VGPHRIDKAYHAFVEERRRTAAYRVVSQDAPDEVVPGWRVVDRVAYRDARFRRHYMTGLERVEAR
jgi:hypothetical protein